MGKMREEILIYWLSKTGHIAKKKYDALVKAYGGLEEAFSEVRKRKFIKQGNLNESLYLRLFKNCDYHYLEEELGELRERGICFLSYFSEAYPEKLRNIYSAPIGLYFRGKLPEPEQKMIAMVGSRAASERGLLHAGRLARELSINGVGIISGMALGIDSASHLGCLEGKSVTVAVLGSGVDICYPKSNFSLYMQIQEKGCILSEFHPGTEPIKTNFPLRNRIISGLSDGVLVVEAREKSGSLITADQGLEQGKNIYAMPGDADFPLSGGTNHLIQMGAKLVMKAEDILEDFHLQYKGLASHLHKADYLMGMEKLVYSIMDSEPRHISSISEETGLGSTELFRILLKLEIEGFVKRVGFEYFVGIL